MQVRNAGSRVQASLRMVDRSDEEFLRSLARAILRRASDGPREVRAAAAHVTESIGSAYAWLGLLRAVQAARMSASMESAIKACISEING
jgi:hypothetical protein